MLCCKEALKNTCARMCNAVVYLYMCCEFLYCIAVFLEKSLYILKHSVMLQGCGYGCQIHHVVYCFIVAYGTKRTLILKSRGWRYNKNGWEDVFRPLSDSCTSPTGNTHSHWPGEPPLAWCLLLCLGLQGQRLIMVVLKGHRSNKNCFQTRKIIKFALKIYRSSRLSL